MYKSSYPVTFFSVLIRLQEENTLISKGWKLNNGVNQFVTFVFETFVFNDYMSRFNFILVQEETYLL